VKRLVEWTFYTENALSAIAKILSHFENISIIEFWDNIFKLKIKKNSNNSSIGFLFGLFEDLKVEFFLSEYSISQTSLEQIFNKFASENDEEVLELNAKKELSIDSEFLHQLIGSGMNLK